MSKAADGLNTATEHAKPSRRQALSMLAVTPVIAGLPAVALEVPAASAAYLTAVTAQRCWFQSCELWGSMHHIHPDYERLTAISDSHWDEFVERSKKCCAEHAAAPSLQGLGEVDRLWRLRCWGTFGPDQMHDEYEISALCTIIEALTPALGDASV